MAGHIVHCHPPPGASPASTRVCNLANGPMIPPVYSSHGKSTLVKGRYSYRPETPSAHACIPSKKSQRSKRSAISSSVPSCTSSLRACGSFGSQLHPQGLVYVMIGTFNEPRHVSTPVRPRHPSLGLDRSPGFPFLPIYRMATSRWSAQVKAPGSR